MNKAIAIHSIQLQSGLFINLSDQIEMDIDIILAYNFFKNLKAMRNLLNLR